MGKKQAAYLGNTLVYCPVCGFLLDKTSKKTTVGEFIEWARNHLPEIKAVEDTEMLWSGKKKVVLTKIYSKGNKKPAINKRVIKIMRKSQTTRYDCGFCGMTGLSPQMASLLLQRGGVVDASELPTTILPGQSPVPMEVDAETAHNVG